MPPQVNPNDETARIMAEVRQLWRSFDPAMLECIANDLIPNTIVKAFADLELGTTQKLSAEAMQTLLSRVLRSLRELSGVRNTEIAIFGEAETAAGAGPLTASYLSLRSIAPEGMEGVADRAARKIAKGIEETPIAPGPDAALSDLLGHYLEGVVPPFFEGLDRNNQTLRNIVNKVEAEAGGEGNIDLTNLAERVAVELQPRAKVLFSPRIKPFPPAVEFGDGDDTVRVSPTVGGTDNPDASINVGVQIDTNPDGEGDKPMTRFSVGVDVDDTGKARGASFGFRCRF